MRLCLAPCVIEKISTGDVCVLGVTSVDDELFVLLQRDDNQVAVYFINDYRLLRHLNLPGLKTHYYSNDMTSCVRHKCIYVCDSDNKCIHMHDLARSAISRWRVSHTLATRKLSVPYTPCGLSVTPVGGNLLVTCQSPNKLVELRADSGQRVREITLQSDIEWTWHGVQLTTGQYVVCHGEWRNLHRVCIVDDDGRVTRSYGGQRGSDVGQLDSPRHLVVDEDSQFIFVADLSNDRVVMLSPTLEFVRYISDGLSQPHRLYLHHSTRRLYVGHWGDDVVIQL